MVNYYLIDDRFIEISKAMINRKAQYGDWQFTKTTDANKNFSHLSTSDFMALQLGILKNAYGTSSEMLFSINYIYTI